MEDSAQSQFDEESRQFFRATGAGTFPLAKCTLCGSYYALPIEICPQDLSASFTTEAASGLGHVHTFGVIHQVYRPEYADKVPYNIAIVELEEGPRVSTSLRGIDMKDIEIGMPVEVMFETVDGLSIPFFKPRSA